jgi:undecaprenyl diphosphate synthase
MPTDKNKTPQHVAIIMDGNGRWATARQMPRVFGHQKGANRVREVVEAAGEIGVKYLTLYAFSNENWGRPHDEVSALFTLLTSYLRSEVDRLHDQNVKLTSIGDRHRLPKECLRLLEKGERKTRQNTGLRLILALSYGGRADIIKTCQNIARQVSTGSLSWKDINPELFSSNLCTWDVPDPDLLIRTSGEERISNFLLWELAYAEFYFCDTCWPDFKKEDFNRAILEYGRRNRRYGSIRKYPEQHLNPDSGGEPC